MHPLGFLIAILTHQQRALERWPSLPPEEPLPPVDDATLRAWRAWARGERPTTRPTADRRRLPARRRSRWHGHPGEAPRLTAPASNRNGAGSPGAADVAELTGVSRPRRAG